MPSLKRSWLLSEPLNWIFFIASIITLISITAVAATQVLVSEPTVYAAHSSAQKVAFYGIFLAASIAVIAQLLLWAAMLGFTVFASERSTSKKMLWLILQLIFVSLGSAVVYFKLYRPIIMAARHSRKIPI